MYLKFLNIYQPNRVLFKNVFTTGILVLVYWYSNLSYNTEYDNIMLNYMVYEISKYLPNNNDFIKCNNSVKNNNNTSNCVYRVVIAEYIFIFLVFIFQYIPVYTLINKELICAFTVHPVNFITKS